MHKPGGCATLILVSIVCTGVLYSLETIWSELLLACSVIVLLLGWFYHHPKLKGNEQNQRIVAVGIAGVLLFFGGMIGYTHVENKQHAEKAAQPKQETKKMDYEGYINKDTFFCDDYETLIRLSDALQKKDKDLMSQLVLEGKIHKVSKDTKVSIIDTGVLDKNAVSIVIEEGRYDLKSGYTFKDWTRRR